MEIPHKSLGFIVVILLIAAVSSSLTHFFIFRGELTVSLWSIADLLISLGFFVTMYALIIRRERAIAYANKIFNELSESEKRFKLLTDTSPDCIKLIDLAGKTVFMSLGGLKEHNFKNSEEAIGWDFIDSIIEEQQESAREAIKRCIAGDPSVFVMIKHKSGASNREWCQVSMTLVKNEGQEPLILAISRDISELKRRGEDIEQLNKHMVGRELKMIELKNKISELEKKQ